MNKFDIIDPFENKKDYMKKQFVTYEIALKLKELGFDEPCICYYDRHNYQILFTNLYGGNPLELSMMQNNYHVDCYAPLWQQAIDWFREKYDNHICIQKCVCDGIDISYTFTGTPWNSYKTYEEAREQAILKAIELCQKMN